MAEDNESEPQNTRRQDLHTRMMITGRFSQVHNKHNTDTCLFARSLAGAGADTVFRAWSSLSLKCCCGFASNRLYLPSLLPMCYTTSIAGDE